LPGKTNNPEPLKFADCLLRAIINNENNALILQAVKKRTGTPVLPDS